MSQSHVRYRLAGESLAAAKIAGDFIDKTINHLNWGNRAAAFIAAHPAEAALLGLDRPVVQAGKCGERLRAYKTFPTLYHAHDNNFYLDCPIAHDGAYFAPKDAAKLGAGAEEKSWQHFYAGMGENIAPLLHIAPEGVPAPQTARHLSKEIDYGGRILSISAWNSAHTYIYSPDAEMLAGHKKFETASVAFDRAVNNLTRAVSGIIDTLVPRMQARQEKKGKICPSVYFSDTEKSLSVYIDNAYLPDHPAFKIKDSRDDNHTTFKLRPNTATAEGQKLAGLFNAIGKRPNLAQELGLPESSSPCIENIGSKPRLITRAPVPGLAEDKEKEWLLKDKEDESCGVKAPPRPF